MIKITVAILFFLQIIFYRNAVLAVSSHLIIENSYIPFIEEFLKPFTNHYFKKPSAVIAKLGSDITEVIKEVSVAI